MARYDNYGKVDDKITEELDTGFIGFNNRLRPDQLRPGTLTVSENGRLDLNGEWQTRKAMKHLASPFQASVLFTDNETDSKLKLFDNPTTNPPSGASVNSSTGVLTITFAGGHGISADYDGHVFFLNQFLGNVEIDGNYLITRISDTEISVIVSGLTSLTSIVSAEVRGLSLDDNAANVIEYALEYSDPNNGSESYILCVGTTSSAVVKCSDGSITEIGYPVNQTASGATAIQVFNKVIIFRDGKVAMEWNGDLTGSPSFNLVENGDYLQPIHISTSDGTFKITDSVATVAESSSVSVGSKVFLVSKTEGSQTSGLASEFEYTVKDVYYSNGVKDIDTAESTSGTGEYSSLFKVTITTDVAHDLKIAEPVSISGFTSSEAAINGKRVVQDVLSSTSFVIYTDSNPNASGSYTGVTVGVSDGFTFVIPEEGREKDSDGNVIHVTDGESLLATPILSEVPSQGSGFFHMPAPPFGEYHQRRLVVPYRYSMSEDSTGTTIENRGIQDEAIFSQALDTDTYDYLYGQFRFNAGTSDYIVGFHSFSDDKLVVFNRNSIHIVSNSFDISQSKNTLITNEVGCIARRSVVQVANNLIFLSDNGVYGVDFQDLYNLRGRDIPISEPIDGTIQNINKNYAHKSVGVYFNNRYYLAAPFGSYEYNNKVIIYNFINKNWESIDSVSDDEWAFSNLVVAGRGKNRGVYAVNSNGGVHRIEASDSAVDQYIPSVGQPTTTAPINGLATTRMYTARSIDRKKWNNFEINVQSSSQDSDANLSAITENIDSTAVDPVTGNLIDSSIDLGSLSELAGKTGGNILSANEDYSIRGRIGNPRAYGLQLSLETTTGRPKLRSVKVAGAKTFRNLETAE